MLTESSEGCLEADNKLSVNCEYNAFSEIPPYTDLTYPKDLLSLGSGSYERDDIVLIVVTVVLVVLLVGSIVGFIVWYRKSKSKKAQYEKISP